LIAAFPVALLQALSNLSPWLHFGQLAPQRAALEAAKLRPKFKESVEGFLEELVSLWQLLCSSVWFTLLLFYTQCVQEGGYHATHIVCSGRGWHHLHTVCVALEAAKLKAIFKESVEGFLEELLSLWGPVLYHFIHHSSLFSGCCAILLLHRAVRQLLTSAAADSFCWPTNVFCFHLLITFAAASCLQMLLLIPAGFCTQVIRRELADNFCHYCPQYDSLAACYDWARDTLAAHAGDKREYLYTRYVL
jgi:hypothetical protein